MEGTILYPCRLRPDLGAITLVIFKKMAAILFCVEHGVLGLVAQQIIQKCPRRVEGSLVTNTWIHPTSSVHAIRTPEPVDSRALHIPLLDASTLHECLPLQFLNHSCI